MLDTTIVMGGQYGSEGKGAFIAWWAGSKDREVLAIRTGGPNAGHSLLYNREHHKMRHIPCVWPNKKAVMALGPGALVDVPFLLDTELPRTENALGAVLAGRFFVDPQAVSISKRHQESEGQLVASIGSTGGGVGAATADRAMRRAVLMENENKMEPYLSPVRGLVDLADNNNIPILIESTQGYGLSLTRSGNYPYVTSRDITPAQVLNDAGVPLDGTIRTVLLFRTYPIRAAGNSGPMIKEINWEELARRTGGYIKPECTTVTRKIRRVAEWDPDLARAAAQACRPVVVVLTFFDYLRPDLADGSCLDADAMRLIERYEKDIGVRIRWVSIGFQKVIDLYQSN